MKKVFIIIFAVLIGTAVSQAKSKQQAREDSIDCVRAIRAVERGSFVMFAERISIGAWNNIVDDDMNFVAVNPKKSMVQLVPVIGHFAGVNLPGTQSNYKVTAKPSKKGDKGPEYNISWFVNGAYINAQVFVTMYRDSNDAMAVIAGAYSGQDITLYGKIFPLELFPEIAGSYDMRD